MAAKTPAKKKAEPAKKKAAKKKPGLKKQLTAALERIEELEAEVASLRGPPPKRLGRQLAMPRGGRRTRALVRQQLMSGEG